MTVVGNFHPASRVLSNLVFAEYPLRDSMDLVELRLDSCFFGSGVFGVRSVWLEKTGVELFFWIWSCLEPCQTHPYITYSN
jgi:hypothetical protein